MKILTATKPCDEAKKIVLEDMILTRDMPTQAGSKMLEGYMSLFDAEVVTRLVSNGYGIAGKCDVGEFAIDLVGESSVNGANVVNSKLIGAAGKVLEDDSINAVVGLDVNGTVRRVAAQSGLVSIKPTYGIVSRFGTIPVACSGETVSVTARDVQTVREILGVIVGHDSKDGTSHSDEVCMSALVSSGKVSRVAVLSDLMTDIDGEVKASMDRAIDSLKANGVEVEYIDSSVIAMSRIAWNVLMSAELCNNVSRYDGVKYGYRTESFTSIEELYTGSRTEAFGKLLKSAILYGSETLSTANYVKVYDKALRMRRVIVDAMKEIFSRVDAILMPACSTMAYGEDGDVYLSYVENRFTAPASITGMPAVVCGGVQIVGDTFSDSKILDIARMIEEVR